MTYRALSALGLLCVAACTDAPTAPDPVPSHGASGAPRIPITVMTQNLYVGADLDAVIIALVGGGDPTLALALAVNQIVGNDLNARIEAIAGSIARHRPQAVGLQEVSEIAVALPAPPFPAPVEIAQNFLPRLLAALEARGLEYQVAAANTNFTADLTPVLGVPARLTDRDVLLVSRHVLLSATSSGSFPCPLCIPLGLFTIQRGWARADARIAGRDITFLTTHLESGPGPGNTAFRLAQAEVLAGMVSGVAHPVILMGDLNDGPGSPMAVAFRDAGFEDLWAAFGAGAGETCCRDPDLRGGEHTQRIDFILQRNAAGDHPHGVRIERVDPDLRSGGPRWPSDHAGLVARILPVP